MSMNQKFHLSCLFAALACIVIYVLWLFALDAFPFSVASKPSACANGSTVCRDMHLLQGCEIPYLCSALPRNNH